jgi:hypothetical protein
LKAVIVGHDKYPGVIERWAMYAPWLDVDWVEKVQFEEMRAQTQRVALRILRHAMSRAAIVFDRQPIFSEEGLQRVSYWMTVSSRQTKKSGTFRKGLIGGWRSEFTKEHVKLFKDTGGAQWLVDLGYERDFDWGVE